MLERTFVKIYAITGMVTHNCNLKSQYALEMNCKEYQVNQGFRVDTWMQ